MAPLDKEGEEQKKPIRTWHAVRQEIWIERMKTYVETTEQALKNRQWFVVDAEGQIVGRLASRIAHLLRGKNNPKFTPHTDTGSFVIVVNADKVKFTGRKWESKTYYHHSGYPGGVKAEVAGALLARKPEQILLNAVKRMLPKTPMGRNQFLKLKVFAGPLHPHAAQQPVPLDCDTLL